MVGAMGIELSSVLQSRKLLIPHSGKIYQNHRNIEVGYKGVHEESGVRDEHALTVGPILAWQRKPRTPRRSIRSEIS